MTEVKLTIEYDDYENGQRIATELEKLAASPDSGSLASLIIGDWGQAYENSSGEVVEALVKHKNSFPALRKLFIGEMSFEECEISWIVQSDLSPLLAAFPDLESLTIQGGNELRLSRLHHDKLEELIIITGGLSSETLADVAGSQLPNLRKLELYLGVEDYGFNGGLKDVLPLTDPSKFPKLTYLGLKNSELQDDIAIALADAPILDQLETLDLSLGTLTDEGAEALLASERIKGLNQLDLHYHYMSEDMMKRWRQSGLQVNVGDRQQSDDDEDWRYPSITE